MEQAEDLNILVADESGIVSFDIKRSLKNHGFRIIEQAGSEEIRHLIRSKTPDLTVTCLKSLTRIMPAKDFYEIWSSMLSWKGNSDTIIFDKDLNPLAFYSKPFNTEEIANFIINHITKPINHENV